MKNFWQNKKVLVTGGTGFIGSFVTELLLEKGADVSVTDFDGDLSRIAHIKKNINLIHSDLREFNDAHKVTKGQEVIMNLAAKVAGIQYNTKHPAIMFSDNVRISQNLIEAGHRNSVERFLIVSSACVYPRHAHVPIPETEGFTGDPEPTNLGYGWGKRVAELLGRFYAQEYGMRVAIARPFNTYGPRDNFDPLTSHVIPGLITRIASGANPLVVWGSGKQSRSFIYVEDLAQGLLDVVEKYPVADPVNLGTDEEITMEELARLIIKLAGVDIRIKFDTSKPDGQPRRLGSTVKTEAKIGFEATTSLSQGLKRTITWYRHHS